MKIDEHHCIGIETIHNSIKNACFKIANEKEEMFNVESEENRMRLSGSDDFATSRLFYVLFKLG